MPLKVLRGLIEAAGRNFGLSQGAELTLEVNPDDMDSEAVEGWKAAGINRLSIGIQSFRQEDLAWMNRAHNAAQAHRSIELARTNFDNYSVDLIYGLPGLDDNGWQENVQRVFEAGAPHVSAYALTVEERTVLFSRIQRGSESRPSDDAARRQFDWLLTEMEDRGYLNYEISNFALPGYLSRNNSAYWQGKPYIGIGPSAHSFDGESRSWNVRSNPVYIRELRSGNLPAELEELSERDRYNEAVMMGLRTIWGVSLGEIRERFGPTTAAYLRERASRYVQEHLLFYDGERLLATRKGKFLVDGIASDLFLLNLKG